MSDGERILLSCFLCTLGMLVCLARAAAGPKPACSVKPSTNVALWPLRSLRTRVTVEPSAEWREATLALYDPDGLPVRVSRVWDQSGGVLAARTTLVDWPDLPTSDPGEYWLVLTVSTASPGHGCSARDHLLVQSTQH